MESGKLLSPEPQLRGPALPMSFLKTAACAWISRQWAPEPSLTNGRQPSSLASDLRRTREWIHHRGHRVFDNVRDAQHCRLIEVLSKNLDADRQAFFVPSARHRDSGNACQVRRDGIDVGQIHGERIVCLLAKLERSSRRRRRNNGIHGGKRVVEV